MIPSVRIKSDVRVIGSYPDHPDTISSAQCRQRFSSYQQLNRIGGATGLIAAIGFVLWNLPVKEQVGSIALDAVFLGVAVWTIMRTCWLARYHSYWQAGAGLIGATLGLGTALLVPLPVLPSVCIGIGLLGNLSPWTVLRVWRRNSIALWIMVILFGRRLTSYLLPYFGYVSGRVYSWLPLAAFRQALYRGDTSYIFATAISVACLHEALASEELPNLLEPVIALAGEENAVEAYAQLSVLCSMPLAYCGEHSRAVTLLQESYGRFPNSGIANSLMCHFQEMGEFGEAMAWGHKAIEHAETAAFLQRTPFRLGAIENPMVLVHLNLADLILDSGGDPAEASPHITKAKNHLNWNPLLLNEQGLLSLVEAKFLVRSGQQCEGPTKDNLQKATGLYLTSGNSKLGAELLLWLGVIEVRNGTLAECKDILEQANTIDDRCLQDSLSCLLR